MFPKDANKQSYADLLEKEYIVDLLSSLQMALKQELSMDSIQKGNALPFIPNAI